MPVTVRAQVRQSLGICLLCCGLVWVAWRASAPRPEPPLPARLLAPVGDRSTFEGALSEARWRRTLAREAIMPALDAADAAVPGGMDGAAMEALRRELMARDRSGELGRARAAARRAQALARTPAERYRIGELWVLIDCDAGQHRQELVEARRLVALRPRDPQARMVLREAETCDGLLALRERPRAGGRSDP